MEGVNSTPERLYRITGLSRLYRLMSLAAVCATGLLLTGCPSTKATSPTDVGWAVYQHHCSVCHGSDARGLVGPALIGSNSALKKYGNAEGLLDYLRKRMPQNYPGSLNEKAYRELLGLLLIKNNFVPSDWKVESGDLSSIILDKSPAPSRIQCVPVTPAPVPVTPVPVPVTPAPVTPTPVPVTPAPVPVSPVPTPVTPVPVAPTPAPVTPATNDLGRTYKAALGQLTVPSNDGIANVQESTNNCAPARN